MLNPIETSTSTTAAATSRAASARGPSARSRWCSAQRRRQDHAAEDPDGPGAAAGAAFHLPATTSPSATPRARRRRASATCRRGARSSAPDRRGEPADGGWPPRPRGSAIPPRIFDMFPVLKQMMHRRGGDLSGGQQQRLCDRPALLPAPAADARRADRGIQPPSSGHRARHPACSPTGETMPSCWSSSTTTSPPPADQYLVMERGEIIAAQGGRTWTDGMRARRCGEGSLVQRAHNRRVVAQLRWPGSHCAGRPQGTHPTGHRRVSAAAAQLKNRPAAPLPYHRPATGWPGSC